MKRTLRALFYVLLFLTPATLLAQAPAAPTFPQQSGATTTTISVDWAPSTGATDYQYDLSTDNFTTILSSYTNKSVGSATSTVNITGLTAATTYYVRVRASSAGGTSASSTVATVKTASTGFVATYDFNSIASGQPYVTDPTPVPTVANLTLGSFSVNGAVSSAGAGRYAANTWGTGTSVGSNYYQTTLTPASGFTLSLSSLTFTVQHSATGPAKYSVRSSLDNYATDLGAITVNPTNANITTSGNVFTLSTGSTAANTGSTITFSAGSFGALTSAVTFRFYAYSASNGTTGTYSVDNVAFTGAIIAKPTATTSAVVTKTAATATLPGTVTDNGAATTVSFDYNPGSSISGSPTNVAGTPGSVLEGAGATSVSAAITGLSANTQYAYRVNGQNSLGITNATALTFFTPPAAPNLSAATAITVSGFTVNWGATSGADSYLLDLSTENTFTTGLVSGYTALSVTGTSQVLSGLSPSTTYYYRVRAVSNANGTGDNSTTGSQATTTPVSPTIIANGTLSALTTITGTASSTTSFTASGVNLNTDITLTAPSGFELSTSATTGFGATTTLIQTGGAVPSTTIYVRLAAADAVGTYSGNVALTSSGATSVNVPTASSTVNAMPVINTTGTLAALTATTGSASSNTSFSASGTNLTADITVTAPAGFEVSTLATTGFGITTTLTQTGGNVPATTVYVRLAASDAVGSYSGNVALASASATTVNVPTASSTVIAAALINATGTLAALTTSSGKASSTTSFSASGSNLTAGINVTAPAGFEVSTSGTTGFAGTITLPQTGGSVASTTVYVRLAAADAGGSYSGNIVLTSASAVAVNVATVSSFVFGTAVETISMGPVAQTYGNPDFAPATSNNTAVPIVYISDNAAVATIINGKVHIVSAGSANITATQAGDATYAAATNVTAPLTVTRAILTATPDNQTKVFGAANPTLTVSYSGFVNNETATVVTTQPIVTSSATTTSAPGNYPITASGAAAANYNFLYKQGTLQVTATATYASLSSISLSTGTFSPAFTPATLSYTDLIDNTHSTATITITAGDPQAIITVNGAVTGTGSVTGTLTLLVGNNNITIVVTSRDGSASQTYTVNAVRGAVTVDAAKSIASNVLSPNGDGVNDAWVIKDIASYPNNVVTVYDRGGRVVYKKKNYGNDWAGTLNGSPLAEDTYYYVIDLANGQSPIKGFVTIVRNRK